MKKPMKVRNLEEKWTEEGYQVEILDTYMDGNKVLAIKLEATIGQQALLTGTPIDMLAKTQSMLALQVRELPDQFLLIDRDEWKNLLAHTRKITRSLEKFISYILEEPEYLVVHAKLGAVNALAYQALNPSVSNDLVAAGKQALLLKEILEEATEFEKGHLGGRGTSYPFIQIMNIVTSLL